MEIHEKILNELEAGVDDEQSQIVYIDYLSMGFCEDGLPILLSIIKDSGRNLSLREHAAKAISYIGSKLIEAELKALACSSKRGDVRELAVIALRRPE